jgi:hydrogenase-4 component E
VRDVRVGVFDDCEVSVIAIGNALLVIVLLLNFLALGTSRIRTLIQTAAAQGVLLGLLPVFLHGVIGVTTVTIAIATITLKGVVIPKMLLKALRDAQVKREIEPLIGAIPTMLLGALGAAGSMAVAAWLPLAPHQAELLVIPASLTTILTGFLLLTTRIKALTQTTGYLILENGVFIFGLLLLEAIPFVVEAGLLLDLFVGVFVISIIINHINRAFSSLDTRRLSSLKD